MQLIWVLYMRIGLYFILFIFILFVLFFCRTNAFLVMEDQLPWGLDLKLDRQNGKPCWKGCETWPAKIVVKTIRTQSCLQMLFSNEARTGWWKIPTLASESVQKHLELPMPQFKSNESNWTRLFNSWTSRIKICPAFKQFFLFIFINTIYKEISLMLNGFICPSGFFLF